MLVGSYGNGKSPKEAVNDDWRQMAEELPQDRYIVIDRDGKREQFRWIKCLWHRM